MIGRRIPVPDDPEHAFAAVEQPGDYCYVPDAVFAVDPETQEPIERRPTIYFLLPGARDDDAPRGQRSVHKVCQPPHVFRECDDGSIEVRESIACGEYWHGYLDEGHVWRVA